MPHDPRPPLTPRAAAVAVVVGAAVTLGLAWTGRPPEAGAGWRAAFVALHLVASGALWMLLRRTGPTVRQLAVGAVVFRALAVPMPPALSDDGYRYLWDGLVRVEAGVSPYALRPSDPRLASLDDGVLLERMNSPDYFSVYPPGAQVVFATAASVISEWGWRAGWGLLKLILLAAEGVAIVCLVRTVGPRLGALYAWSPLAVVEIAGQGHTEALVVAGLGLVLVGGRGVPWSSIGATVGGLVKLYPLALLPWTWRRDGLRGVAASGAIAAVLTMPFWAPGALGNASESLGLFFGTFDEFAAPYRVAKAALYPFLGEPAGRAASLALSAVLLAALAVAWLGDDGTRRALRAGVAVLVLGVALTASTFHPWYGLAVLFVVPLLQFRLPWWWLTSTASLGYLTYVLPAADLPVLAVGWGGALVLALRPRGDRGEHALDRR